MFAQGLLAATTGTQSWAGVVYGESSQFLDKTTSTSAGLFQGGAPVVGVVI